MVDQREYNMLQLCSGIRCRDGLVKIWQCCLWMGKGLGRDGGLCLTGKSWLLLVSFGEKGLYDPLDSTGLCI